MPRQPIPAEGFKLITGTRAPPKRLGEYLWCQLRNGWVDIAPWPVATTIWVHDGTNSDVVAIREVDK